MRLGPLAVVVLLVLSACDLRAPTTAVVEVVPSKTAPETTIETEAPAFQSRLLLSKFVLGRGAAEIRALLGEPELARQDPPAQMWQYRGRGCVLSLFLYDGPIEAAVRHLEARNESGQRIQADSCLTLVAQKT